MIALLLAVAVIAVARLDRRLGEEIAAANQALTALDSAGWIDFNLHH